MEEGNIITAKMAHDFQKFYKECLSEERNLSKLVIPDGYNPAIHLLIPIVDRITFYKIIHIGMKKVFVDDYNGLHIGIKGKDLDKPKFQNSRLPVNGSYLIAVKDVINASDPLTLENKDIIQGITLYERLILEVYHYYFYGQYLDTGGCTICSGTIFERDSFVTVEWDTNCNEIDVFTQNIHRLEKCFTREVFV